MYRLFLFLLLLFLAPVAARAQVDQSLIHPYDLAHPLTIRKLNRLGDHQTVISRDFANEKEEKLLQIAEAVYPPERAVRLGRNEQPQTSQPEQRLWWCNSFDGVLVPYAITKRAVTYYLEVQDKFRAGKFSIKMHGSALGYSAKIAHHKSYPHGEATLRDVYVVSLDLAWSQYCGTLCAMGFKTKRTVVLDEQGKVLAVQNDECVPTVIS